LVLPFWYRLTWVVPDKGPINARVYTGQLVDFVGAKFYCPHAHADINQHIQIREKTLEFII